MLTGRADMLAALERWRSSARRSLSLWGEPGVGKSALVEVWASSREDVVHIALDRVSNLDELAARLSAALLERGHDAPTVEEQLQLASDTTVILDDADELGPAFAELIEHMLSEADGWRLIVTSRVAMRWAERIYEITPLQVEDGVALLSKLTGTPSSDSHLTTLAMVLDGNPLAITLAARRARVMNLEELVARLRARKRTLGGGLGRFASIEEAAMLSIERLDPMARLALGRALVFANAFTLEAAEAILTAGDDSPLTPDALLDALQVLVEAALLRRLESNPTRFHVSRALRPHLSVSLAPDLEAVEEAHRVYFAERARHLAESNLPTDPLHEALRVELDDILAARSRAPRDENLCVFLSWLLTRRGTTTTWLGTSLTAERDPHEQALALRRNARALLSADREGAARTSLERALTILGDDHQDRALLSELRVAMIKLFTRAGDSRSAALESEKLWFLERERGEDRRAAKVAWRGARIWVKLGERERALLDLDRFDSVEPGVIPELITPARVLRAELLVGHDDARARELAADALLALATTPDADLTRRAHLVLGDLAAAARDFEGAERAYRRAMDASPKTPDVAIAVRLHDVLDALGEDDRARACLPDVQDEAVLARRAVSHLATGDLTAARDLLSTLIDEREGLDEGALGMLAIALSELIATIAGEVNDARTLCEAIEARASGSLARCMRACCVLLDGSTPPPAPDRWRASEGVSDFFADRIEGLCGKLDLARDRTLASYWLGISQRASHNACLYVEEGAASFVLPSGERVSLGRKMLLRRLLAALVAHRLDRPGESMAWEELFAQGWPGEAHTSEEAALNRLRVAIRRLRAMGLEQLILTDDDGGYLLDQQCQVESIDPPVEGA